MEETLFHIKINGEEKQYKKGTPYQEIAAEYQSQFGDDIVLVLFNNRLRELRRRVKGDGEHSLPQRTKRGGKHTGGA